MRRIAIYFKQFWIWEGFKLLTADSFRKLLDPFSVSSYSQTGEDRIISHLLGSEKSGFYVDVGCNHPKKCSNTFALYKKGWRGLMIDANNELINEAKRIRINDEVICALVSDVEQEMTFTEFEDPLLSSVDATHIALWNRNEKRKIRARKIVKSKTLGAILKKIDAPKNFQLLTIDVEGHDFKVLKSVDLDVYRPTLIVIEIHEFDLENAQSNKIYSYLKEQCYAMVGYAINNGYFLDVAEDRSIGEG